MKFIYLLFISTIASSIVFGQTTSYGINAGDSGNFSSFIGYNCGTNNTAVKNTFLGHASGYVNTTGKLNTFLGMNTGRTNKTGTWNLYAGALSGYKNQAGHRNVHLGYAAGYESKTNDNTFVGYRSGRFNGLGNTNTFLGANSGFNSEGSGNVFLGYQAGFDEDGSDLLYIDNSSTDTPLIYGDFAADQIGINTNYIPADYAMAINGKVIAEEVRVQLESNWPDYVFEQDYTLMPLDELKVFIQENKHLPEVPSSTEMEQQGGIDMGEMQTVLLKKVEELSLYVLELKAEIDALKTK